MRRMWSGELKNETKIFRIFTVIRESSVGLFSKEIHKKVDGVEYPTVLVCLQK